MKIIGMKHTFELPLLLTCLPALALCSDSEEETDRVIVEAKEAKAELEKVNTILRTTQGERAQLVEDLAQIAGERIKPSRSLLLLRPLWKVCRIRLLN